jgi:hypothetical protein
VRFPDDPAPSVSGKRAKVPREPRCISQGAETPHRLLLADPDMRSLGVEKVIHVDPCPTFEYPRTLSANVKKRGRVSLASRVPTVLGCGQPIWTAMAHLASGTTSAWMFVVFSMLPRVWTSHASFRYAAHSASRAKAASIRCIASIASSGETLLVGGISPAILAVSSSKNSSAFLLYPRLS